MKSVEEYMKNFGLRGLIRSRALRILGLIGLFGCWLIDVSNAVMGNRIPAATLGNGFWEMSANQVYHLGLWAAIIIFVAFILWEE